MEGATEYIFSITACRYLFFISVESTYIEFFSMIKIERTRLALYLEC